MGVTQYIGSRYVPVFADPAEWNSTRTYEPLTIVMHEGNSYTSKQYVPKGIDISNNDFWAETGNYNAQVEQYRKDVVTVKSDLAAEVSRASEAESKISGDLAAEVSRASEAESKISGELNKDFKGFTTDYSNVYNTPDIELVADVYNTQFPEGTLWGGLDIVDGFVYVGTYKPDNSQGYISKYSLSNGTLTPVAYIEVEEKSIFHCNSLSHLNGKLYVCNGGSNVQNNKVGVIDLATFTYEKTITLPYGITSIATVNNLTISNGNFAIIAQQDASHMLTTLIADSEYNFTKEPCYFIRTPMHFAYDQDICVYKYAVFQLMSYNYNSADLKASNYIRVFSTQNACGSPLLIPLPNEYANESLVEFEGICVVGNDIYLSTLRRLYKIPNLALIANQNFVGANYFNFGDMLSVGIGDITYTEKGMYDSIKLNDYTIQLISRNVNATIRLAFTYDSHGIMKFDIPLTPMYVQNSQVIKTSQGLFCVSFITYTKFSDKTLHFESLEITNATTGAVVTPSTFNTYNDLMNITLGSRHF